MRDILSVTVFLCAIAALYYAVLKAFGFRFIWERMRKR